MKIKVDQVSKNYLQGESTVHALDGVSFEVPAGETLAVVGSSGSGKTTLLTLMTGLEIPSNGEIYFDQTALSKQTEKERAAFRSRHIGIVFQQFHLMPHLTALENVELPLEILGQSNIREQALEQLKNVGLEKRVHHFPHQLSGGESQRVAIARALIHKPNFLFADEPSGNLDTDNGEKIMTLLFERVAAQKSTLILITHDLTLAERCARQLRLHGGRQQ